MSAKPMIVKRKRKAPVEPETQPPDELGGLWSCERLYGRSQENRRVLALELFAFAIYCVESCETLPEFEAFEQELREIRCSTWGQRPWSGAAKDADRFEDHILDIARGFTITPATYRNRLMQPLARQ